MPFNRENAIHEIKRALIGATARDKNAVLQYIIDDHAQNNKKKMCLFPQCGTWVKKGNHNWEDIKRLVSASNSMNSPLVTITENNHCDTTILCSSKDAYWCQEQLHNGKHRVFVSMDVEKPVSITSSIEEVASMDKSPFNKKRKLPCAAPKAVPVFVSASSVLPELNHVPEIIANPDYELEFVESLFAASPLEFSTPVIIQQAPVIIAPRTVKPVSARKIL